MSREEAYMRVRRIVEGILEETLDNESILSELEQLALESPETAERAARLRNALEHANEAGVTAMLHSQAKALEHEWERRKTG